MREKNTGEPRTDFSPPGRLLLAPAASLLLLAAGCGGAGAAAKNIWENTKKTVSDTLVSISKYQRESAEKPGASEAKAAARPAAARRFQEPLPSRKRPPRNAARAKSAPFQDRFPSRGHSPKEENLNPGEAQGAGGRTARGEGSREASLTPGALLDPEALRQRIREVKQEERRARRASRRRRLAQERRRLERMLRKSRKEEKIIQEMEQLRERLRELQKDLLEIQRADR